MDDSTTPSRSNKIKDTKAVSSLPPSSWSTKINLTLVIDKRNKRVLYAEAGKDFVDFLFGLFELPAGFVLGLLIGRGLSPKGSIGRIYQNIRDFDFNFLQSPQVKHSLLRPKETDTTKQNPLLKELTKVFQQPKQQFSSTTVLGQTGSYSRGSQASDFVPPPVQSIQNIVLQNLLQQRPPSSRNARIIRCPSANPIPLPQVDGYVKGETVRYIVMDDLTVKPMSSITSLGLLKSFQVRDVDFLEEKTVEIDLETALKLVDASIESTTALTSVFFPTVAEPGADVEIAAKETTLPYLRKEN